MSDACPESQMRDETREFAGRRRTSLKGGNRGMHRCSCGRLDSYGDLMFGSRAVRGNWASGACWMSMGCVMVL